MTRLLFRINKATKWCSYILLKKDSGCVGGGNADFLLLWKILIPLIKSNSCGMLEWNGIPPFTYMWYFIPTCEFMLIYIIEFLCRLAIR